jgi:hypothetical protein
MAQYLYKTLPPDLRGFCAETSGELAGCVASDIRPGDIITVKGSKVMSMHLIVEAIHALTGRRKKTSVDRATLSRYFKVVNGGYEMRVIPLSAI